MSTPDPPTGSGTSRRRVQRFKRGGYQIQLGSHARTAISQMLHRKGQTHISPDTDERSLTIGSFHGAPLGARMHSPHVHPTAGRKGELDNNCLYLHHPSRRLELQSPLALASLSPNHSPELIDNLYLTGVYSTNSSTTKAFLIFIYIPEATPDDIASIIFMQLNEMQKAGALNHADDYTGTMRVHRLVNTNHTTYLDDEQLS